MEVKTSARTFLEYLHELDKTCPNLNHLDLLWIDEPNGEVNIDELTNDKEFHNGNKQFQSKFFAYKTSM